MKLPKELCAAMDRGLVPPDLYEKGWRYLDPPTKFSPEMWDYFLRLIGEGEYKLLVYSEGVLPDGFKFKRGQFVISPQGMENLANKKRCNELATPHAPDSVAR